MRNSWLAIAFTMLAVAPPAHASPPLTPDMVASVAATLPLCSGGWYEAGSNPRRLIGPDDLTPRLSLLRQPSTDLDQEAGEDLYAIAKALLIPSIAPPDFILDPTSSLQCPARPTEGVAIMRYLVGERPNDWRGYVNAFDWLGVATEQGIGTPVNVSEARLYFLRGRMHSIISSSGKWSDGIDNDLIANIERAGYRPYLEELSQIEEEERSGGAARMILAEEALAEDPNKARRLLRTHYIPALNRLLELEASGQVPILHDHSDIEFWSEAWQTMMGFKKWAARLLKGVELANGGTIPTSPQRPRISELRSFLTFERVDDPQATRDPIPVRALVGPEGEVLYVENCQASPIPPDTRLIDLNVRLDAARLYLGSLPKLPITHIDGEAAYGWVILPAVHFGASEGGNAKIAFASLHPEACAYSGLLDKDAALP